MTLSPLPNICGPTQVDPCTILHSMGRLLPLPRKVRQGWKCSMLTNDQVWLDALSREQKSQHREWRVWDSHEIINTPFDWHCICSIHLIYLKYSGVLFPNGHFEPTPFLNPSNAPSLTLLIRCSLSLSLSLCLLHTLFSPVAIWYKYSDNFVGGIIE